MIHLIKKSTIILFILLITFGCANQQKSKLTITVTVLPQKYFAEKIVGDKMNVVCMIPSGSNPEAYDPSPSQLVNLSKSKAFLAVGNLGFELAWLDKLKKNHPNLILFNTSDSIELINDHTGHHNDIHNGHSHVGTDPHTWSSPRSAAIMAKNICKAIISIDPKNKKLYEENLKILLSEIKETDFEISKKLHFIKDRSFLIYHPALTYLARDYGLNQFCVEFNGKEPTPQHLKSLIDIAKKEGVHIIFVQKEFDIKNAQILAEQTNCKIVSIDPLKYDWKESTMEIVNALCNE